MVTYYPRVYSNVFCILSVLLMTGMCWSQEAKVFTLSDFDLHGPVESCMVITKYGKEAYEFNKAGQLLKSTTQYNEQDYDVTYYKYINNQLEEKRFEIYRDNEFDRATSYVNIYTTDSLNTSKLTEQIISYDRELLEQYQYFKDEQDRTIKVIRANENGYDETSIAYEELLDGTSITTTLNEVVIQTETRTDSFYKENPVTLQKITKNYQNGDPQFAEEVMKDASGKLLKKTHSKYNAKKEKFVVDESSAYTYDEQGILSKVEIVTNSELIVKEYIYQFDKEEGGNWIKEIITPDNTYTTRKISYFELESTQEEKE